MPSKRRSLLAAAGNAGSDPLYVEDVFSTFVYTGNATARTIANGIALGDTNYGASVEFNGTSDSLTRASDFSGNANANSFTFSCWCFKAVDGVTLRIFTNGQSSGTDSGLVVYAGNNALVFIARDASDVTIFSAYAYTNILPLNVWTNVLISVDLSSASNRYIYMNDVDVTSSFTFSQYTNGYINFTTTTQNIGKADGISSQLWQGKLSSLFLDYTYRDLSVTSNRRLFITADGQPAANQASLNPIMFMPLDDTNAIGKNLGTGGDFTANGPPTALSQGGPYIEAGYGKGGLVWIKNRTDALSHMLSDTVSGANKQLNTNTTNAQGAQANILTAFNSNSFTIGTDGDVNTNAKEYVSWTFRKAEKFFDVVTYTGNNSAGEYRQISHNLGSTPAAVIQKNTTDSSYWYVYHKDTAQPGDPDYATHGYYLNLDRTVAKAASNTVFPKVGTTAGGVTAVYDSSVFTIGEDLNESGKNYVLYLFASDAGGFGDDGSESIIKCGSYTTDSSGNASVTLGFEPQWVLNKTSSYIAAWSTVDMMRGFDTLQSNGYNQAPVLSPNTSNAEFLTGGKPRINATGFTVTGTTTSQTFIYIAIRRPMKTPEAGTEVFAPVGATTTAPLWKSSFPVDVGWYRYIIGTSAGTYLGSRLTGTGRLESSNTAAEATDSTFTWDYMNGWFENSFNDTNYVGYNFKRATGFMDVVAYTGNSAVSTVDNKSHNLGVVPELIIFKDRSGTDDWQVYHSALGETKQIRLNMTYFEIASAYMNNTAPTSSVFTANGGFLNSDGVTYIAYLFATLAGVSKVGSYTGTAATLNVDCGFTAGARFILIKRSDAVGDWFTYDSFRGITAGNDPYLLLNTTAAQVTNTDYIDPLNAGFTVTSTAPAGLNANGGTYIFLAIA